MKKPLSPGSTIDGPTIKLLLLDSDGRTIGDSGTAHRIEESCRTSIAFSIEGRVVMGWSARSDGA